MKEPIAKPGGRGKKAKHRLDSSGLEPSSSETYSQESQSNGKSRRITRTVTVVTTTWTIQWSEEPSQPPEPPDPTHGPEPQNLE